MDRQNRWAKAYTRARLPYSFSNNSRLINSFSFVRSCGQTAWQLVHIIHRTRVGLDLKKNGVDKEYKSASAWAGGYAKKSGDGYSPLVWLLQIAFIKIQLKRRREQNNKAWLSLVVVGDTGAARSQLG